MRINPSQSTAPVLHQQPPSTADATSAASAGQWSRPAAKSSSATGAAKPDFDFNAHDFNDLKLGKQLFKDVLMTIHDVPEKNATLVKMNPNVGSLNWGLEDLGRVQKAGIPTASVQQLGRRQHMDCALVQRFAQVHETTPSGARSLVQSNLTSPLTLDSLRKIRNGLEASGLQLKSPRLGMEASGAIRVLPGLMVDTGTGSSNKAQLQQFDAMISAVQTRLDKARTQA